VAAIKEFDIHLQSTELCMLIQYVMVNN